MERMMLPVVPIKPQGDKRARLQVVAPDIKNGTVLFPRTGCEDLLGQVFNLGIDSHDDLCDGLSYLLQGLAKQGLEPPKIHWIEGWLNNHLRFCSARPNWVPMQSRLQEYQE
jgi:phage terminase large subunit-like protein